MENIYVLLINFVSYCVAGGVIDVIKIVHHLLIWLEYAFVVWSGKKIVNTEIIYFSVVTSFQGQNTYILHQVSLNVSQGFSFIEVYSVFGLNGILTARDHRFSHLACLMCSRQVVTQFGWCAVRHRNRGLCWELFLHHWSGTGCPSVGQAPFGVGPLYPE
jgi:hypothetical protein